MQVNFYCYFTFILYLFNCKKIYLLISVVVNLYIFFWVSQYSSCLPQIRRSNSNCFGLTQSRTIFSSKKQKIDQIQTECNNKTLNISQSIVVKNKTIKDHSLRIYKIHLDQQIPINDIFYQLLDSKLNKSQRKKSYPKARFLQIIKNKNSYLYIERNQSQFITQYQGKAMLFVSDGRRIQGFWNQHKFQGSVKIIYSNKVIYFGQIDDKFKKTGEGNLYFPEGGKFVGKFKNGKIQGKGKLYDNSQKIIQKGVWSNGQIICSNRA